MSAPDPQDEAPDESGVADARNRREPRSGEGSQTALEALIRKRRQQGADVPDPGLDGADTTSGTGGDDPLSRIVENPVTAASPAEGAQPPA